MSLLKFIACLLWIIFFGTPAYVMAETFEEEFLQEGEEVCFSTPVVEKEEKGKNADRVVYRVTAPSSNPGHTQMGGLCPAELQEHMPARRGKKVVEYFWFPVDGDNED